MPSTLFERLDAFGRRHPRLTALLTLALAATATAVLLSQYQVTTIAYEGF